MLRLFILICFTGYLAILPLHGQVVGVSVKGKVLDADNHPIEMVNISVKGTTIGVVTNTNGEFNLPSVSGKKIKLVFSSVGFEKVEKEVDLIKNPFITLVMKPDLQKIEEIVVEGRTERNNNTISINCSYSNPSQHTGLL